MSLIIPANTLASGGYTVDNSCRFNFGSSDYLNRSVGGNSTLSTKGTWSTWVKKSNPGSSRGSLFSGYADASNRVYLVINTDAIVVFGKVGGTVRYTAQVDQYNRDPSAWMNIVVAIDTTQGTDTNRIKIFINGTIATIGSTNTPVYPVQDSAIPYAATNSYTNLVGALYSTSLSQYLDGYLAETVFVDGLALDATSFGEFDEDSGIWKPKSVSGLTFGTNGFYLETKQSGTSQNSSGLGADTSGNDNHFAVNNLTAIDQSTDTCTNNFATMNPLLAKSVIFAEGNLSTTTTSTGWHITHSTIGITTGKWYMECKIIGFDHCIVGLGNEAGSTGTATYPLGVAGNYGYNLYNGQKTSSDGAASYGATLANNDILGIAIDLDNLKIYFSKNGTYQNSGNPTSGSTGTGSAFNLLANQTYFPMAVVNVNSTNPCGVNWNFGSPAYAISSGNTDGDGYGNFEYAVPSGYFALNTKNLAEYG